ncbi:MAG: rhomboid family intramembrane serine protease [Flavobacteriales bacterium]|nr:rhomboid family intramembrane serine protease [Flavobacteriales bacterium]
MGIDLDDILGLHNWRSEKFMPHQFITHIFMHANIMHIFFNMFMLWMFGRMLESVWGSKRFLIYYMLCGLGAAGLQMGVNTLELNAISNEVHAFAENPDMNGFIELTNKYGPALDDRNFPGGTEILNEVNDFRVSHHTVEFSSEQEAQRAVYYVQQCLRGVTNIGMVGASGAVFGIFLGFGMLFPNTVMIMLFLPFPIKAKYMVAIMAAFELYMGIQNNDSVAHFAHLGGALVGFIIIKYWNSRGRTFY